MQPHEILLLLLTPIIRHISCKSTHREPMVCAGDLEYVCQSNFCYDAFDVNKNTVRSGCANKTTCESAGCFIVRNEFVCCCPYSVCNGKSEEVMKARLSLWKRENYEGKQPTQTILTSQTKPVNPTNIKSIQSFALKSGTTLSVKSKAAAPAKFETLMHQNDKMQNVKQTTSIMPSFLTTARVSATRTDDTDSRENSDIIDEASEEETSLNHLKILTNTTNYDKKLTTAYTLLLTRASELDIPNSNSSKTQDSGQQDYESDEEEESETNDGIAIDASSTSYLKSSNVRKEEETEEANEINSTVTSIVTEPDEIRPSILQSSITSPENSVTKGLSQAWKVSTVSNYQITAAENASIITGDNSTETEDGAETSSTVKPTVSETTEIEEGSLLVESTTEQSADEDMVKMERFYPHLSDDYDYEHPQDNDTDDGELDKSQGTMKQHIIHGATIQEVSKSIEEHFHADAIEEEDMEDKTDVHYDDEIKDNDDGKSKEEYKDDNKHEMSSDDKVDDDDQNSEEADDVTQNIQETAETTNIPMERKTSTLRVERGEITTRPRSADINEESQKSIWKSGLIPWWLVVFFGLMIATITGGLIYKVIKARRSRKRKLRYETAQEMTPLKKITESAE